MMSDTTEKYLMKTLKGFAKEYADKIEKLDDPDYRDLDDLEGMLNAMLTIVKLLENNY